MAINVEEKGDTMPSLDDILDKLQKLSPQYHWALSDAQLLLAIYGNKPVVRKSRLFFMTILAGFSQRVGMVWPLIYLIGTVVLVKLLVRQYALTKNINRGAGDYPACFFVGFGVAKEEELISQYNKHDGGTLGMLHQYKIETFAFWHRVDVLSGFRSLFNAIVFAKRAVAALPDELVCRRVDFHTHIASKIGYYSYVRAWFAILAARSGSNPVDVAFSCQNLAAFAAVDAGIGATYFSHGMITRCELLPAFATVRALTTYEANFIRHRLPSAHVTVYSPARQMLAPSQMAKEILITSCPVGGNPRYMQTVIPLIRWAKIKKIPVRVRLHPSEDATYFWSDYVNEGLVTIAEGDVDFFQTIDRLKPRLLVSWVSTTLADVLHCGVIPITASLDDDLYAAELVYPIFQRCLKLSEEFKFIERLLCDDEYYESVLSRLCAV